MVCDLPPILSRLPKSRAVPRRHDRTCWRSAVVPGRVAEAEAAYNQIYERHIPLAHFLRDLGAPLPKAIRTAAEFAINSHLRQVFAEEEMDLERIRKLLEEARFSNFGLESNTLEFTLRLTIERLFERLAKEPPDPQQVARLKAIVEMARSLPFEVILWTAQNVWSEMRRTVYQEVSQREQEGEDAGAAGCNILGRWERCWRWASMGPLSRCMPKWRRHPAERELPFAPWGGQSCPQPAFSRLWPPKRRLRP